MCPVHWPDTCPQDTEIDCEGRRWALQKIDQEFGFYWRTLAREARRRAQVILARAAPVPVA